MVRAGDMDEEDNDEVEVDKGGVEEEKEEECGNG